MKKEVELTPHYCTHTAEPYYIEYYRRDVWPSEPTEDAISRSRLWKCPDCGMWYSHIGATSRPPLIIEKE